MHKIFSKNLFIGKKVVYLPKCHSTNVVASQLAAIEHVSEGTIVIAEEQLAGKGQRGNTWESEPGKNITMSTVLKPSFLEPGRQFLLNVVASLAVKGTLEEFEIAGVKVKWPNDIYVQNRKITGILIENTLRGSLIETAIVGIGLNVNQVEFAAGRPTSMALETGKEVDKELVLEKLTGLMEAYYLQLKGGNADKLMHDYQRAMIGWQEVRTYSDSKGQFAGKILGVSPRGKLQVEHSENVTEYDLKEIEFIL